MVFNPTLNDNFVAEAEGVFKKVKENIYRVLTLGAQCWANRPNQKAHPGDSSRPFWLILLIHDWGHRCEMV